MNTPTLAIAIPCYNEEKLIKSTTDRLLEVLLDLESQGKISNSSFIYLIDDGSKDNTWAEIEKANQSNPSKIKGVKFTRNFGNQSAHLAGLLGARELDANCVITIDADLQQDENSIGDFVQKYQDGADIVFGVRKDRKTDSIFKKYTALCFYKLMNLLGAKTTPNHSDFRLVSRKALDVLAEYKETNLFLRGIFQELGLKTDYVKFSVKPRKVGNSKFSPQALFVLAMNGLTSFSIVPLRLVSVLGILMALCSFGLGLEVIYEKFILNNTIPGWATMIVATSFIGGVQIFCIGIIGEYLGQVYQEVKARPRFVKETELK